jgi:hypothetical protein
METGSKEAEAFLLTAGYRRLETEAVEPGGLTGSEFDLHFHLDAIFLHPSVVWGEPV